MGFLLFHKDIYFPDHAKKPLFEGLLTYGNHARNVAQGNDRVPRISLPTEFIASNAVLIEVELNDKTGEVEKQVWRQPLDAEWDICFPMLKGGFVKTVWLNHKSDTHKTLVKSKFTTGFQWRTLRGKLQSTGTASSLK